MSDKIIYVHCGYRMLFIKKSVVNKIPYLLSKLDDNNSIENPIYLDRNYKLVKRDLKNINRYNYFEFFSMINLNCDYSEFIGYKIINHGDCLLRTDKDVLLMLHKDSQDIILVTTNEKPIPIQLLLNIGTGICFNTHVGENFINISFNAKLIKSVTSIHSKMAIKILHNKAFECMMSCNELMPNNKKKIVTNAKLIYILNSFRKITFNLSDEDFEEHIFLNTYLNESNIDIPAIKTDYGNCYNITSYINKNIEFTSNSSINLITI